MNDTKETVVMIATAMHDHPHLKSIFEPVFREKLGLPALNTESISVPKRKTPSISESSSVSSGDISGGFSGFSEEEPSPEPSPKRIKIPEKKRKAPKSKNKERNEEKWGLRWHTCSESEYEFGKIIAIRGDTDEPVIYCEERPNKYVRLVRSGCSKTHYYLLQEVSVDFEESDIIDSDVKLDYMHIKKHKEGKATHKYPQFCIPFELLERHLETLKNKNIQPKKHLRPTRKRNTIQDDETPSSSPKLRVKPRKIPGIPKKTPQKPLENNEEEISEPQEKEQPNSFIPENEHQIDPNTVPKGEIVLNVEKNKTHYYLITGSCAGSRLTQNSDGYFYLVNEPTTDMTKKAIYLRGIAVHRKEAWIDYVHHHQYAISISSRTEHVKFLKEKGILQ